LLCLAVVSHVASLAKAGNELGAEYLVAITFFALVPLLMLGGLKFLDKHRLKAEKRAAAAAVRGDASAPRAGWKVKFTGLTQTLGQL
jgi:hypothetical protein